ncbi:alpha-1,2-fucosyltransferase [Candidatus Pseudothioglobus sp. Uisw_050_01]|uniref:alpha-1,2-fucosyltransferase n=1 Tax=Candidatus Pseudothioglobus sp. Uisw_050_01 TaxID=3230997 RepID=UPI003A8598BD
MIVYYSSWGVGNELFQYAYLRSLAKNNENIFCLGGMEELADGFDLKDLNFHIYIPSRAINSIMRILIFPALYWLAKKRIFNYFEHLRDEKGVYDKKVSKKTGLIPVSIVKQGFFQSEMLFNIDNIKVKTKDHYFQSALKIFNSFPNDRTKVFVHVRRGDYLREFYNNKRGVNLPFSYYSNAISLIENEVNFPYYIFLSDDPEYVEQAFRHISDSDKYISSNHPIVDFSLMTLCKYGIGSNSTFAWWGSYLMKYRKKVFFPKYWHGWREKVESHPGIQPSWSEIIDID